MKEIKDIREVQKISLNLLNVFDSFCKKNDLHYYLAFGTLLGAIRHKGFIPWDDDIDLMMERDEFDRLVNLHVSRPAPNVRFYSYKNSRLYENTNFRVSDENTVVDLLKIENPVNQGIWLTVFPIDNIPDNRKKRSIFLKSIYYRYKFLFVLTEKDTFLDTRPAIIKAGIKALKKTVSVSRRKKMYYAFHRYLRKYCSQKTKDVAILSIGTGNTSYFSRSCIDTVEKCEFEGKLYPIPSGYDEVLRNYYGDYMQLPPVEEQVPKHSFNAYYKTDYQS